jgi:hypothetical protein
MFYKKTPGVRTPGEKCKICGLLGTGFELFGVFKACLDFSPKLLLVTKTVTRSLNITALPKSD